MTEIPREIVEAAARTSSLHYESCDTEGCRDCRAAYITAHYALHGALPLLLSHFAPTPPAPAPHKTANEGNA